MNPFTESNLVEQTVIKLIKELWQDSSCHINAYSDSEDAKLGRAHRGELFSFARECTNKEGHLLLRDGAGVQVCK